MIEQGNFKCPKCHKEEMFGYTRWQKKLIDNQEKWIFYSEKHLRGLWWYTIPGPRGNNTYFYESSDRCWSNGGSTEEDWNKDGIWKCDGCGFIAETFTEFCSKDETNNFQINNSYQNLFQMNPRYNNFLCGAQFNNQTNNKFFYEFQINELQKQLNEEKCKNNILINENTRLNNMINNLGMEINNLNMRISNIQNYENRIESLEKEVKEKKDEIQKYTNEFLNNQLGNSITSINPGESILAIKFISKNIQNIDNYCLPCKNVDLFVRLEEKLNNNFPQLKEHETCFEINDRRIKRFKTLDENEIKNNDVINVILIDSENKNQK